MKKTIILYGSLTGNTQMTAMTLAAAMGCESMSFDEITQDIIDSVEMLIVGVSTWGEGEYNPATEDFVVKLGKGEIKVENKKIALFGLGDLTYQIFCGAVEKLKDEFEKHKAIIVGDIHKVDGWMDEEKEEALLKWAKKNTA